jgi:hypothetical protein
MHDASWCCNAWSAHGINLLQSQISVRCGGELSLVLQVAGGSGEIGRVRSRFKPPGLLSFLSCHEVEKSQAVIIFLSKSHFSLDL